MSGAVPLIDMARYYAGDTAAKRQLAREVDAACRDTGFLTVEGHGIPTALTDSVIGVARQFFALPLDDKLAFRGPPDTMLRGYAPFMAHRLARSRGVEAPADLREAYSLGRPGILPGHAVADPDAAAFYRPNLWPDRPADFRAVYTDYYTQVDRLARDLMRVFALALELEETYFDSRIDDHFAALNTFFYPAQTDRPQDGQFRAGAHSDFGSLTILLQEAHAGGLEVMGKDGAWQYVPPQPGRFVINIGDLMAQWTNDRWCSTLHRVVNPPGETVTPRSRVSVGFFCHPNFETVIQCLPSCLNEDGNSKYPPVKAGAYMRRKIMAVRMPPAASAA